MTGRPSTFSPELAEEICSQIAQGKSLRAICRDPGMPSQNAVFTWVWQHASFHEKYARATFARTDVWAEEIIEIAEQAATFTDSTAVNAARLRVDARKWLMSRLNPRKYGDRVELAGDRDQPLTIAVVRYGEQPLIEHVAAALPAPKSDEAEETSA